MANFTNNTTFTPVPYWNQKADLEAEKAKWFSSTYMPGYWQRRLEKQLRQGQSVSPQQIQDYVDKHSIEFGDVSFATVNQNLQQYAYYLLQPFQTYQRSVKPTAVKVAYLASISKIGRLINANGISNIAAGASGGAALLLLKHLQTQVKQQMYYIQAAQNPQALAENLMFQTVKGALIKQSLAASQRVGQLAAYSLAPGLFDNRVRIPHPDDPKTDVIAPVFKPTRWANKSTAQLLDNWSQTIANRRGTKGQSEHTVFTYALKKQANEFRKNKRRSALWWALYPLALLGSVLSEAALAWLYKVNPVMASIVRGYLGQIAKAAVSVRSVGYGLAGAIGLNRLGLPSPLVNIPIPFTGITAPVAVTGIPTYMAGWYHQSVVNLANNFTTSQYDIFTGNSPQAVLMREKLMPLSYKSTYGNNYYQNPQAINQYVKDFGRPRPWTGLPEGLGSEQWDFLDAKWTNVNNKSVLGLNKLARLYFKHPFIGGSISGLLDGLMLSIALGLPWQYALALSGGMALMGGLSTSPMMRNLKTYALLGAGLGAEIGLLTGNNPLLFGGIGLAAGTTANLLTNLGNITNISTPAYLMPGWYHQATLKQVGLLTNPVPGVDRLFVKDLTFTPGAAKYNLFSSANWPEVLRTLQNQNPWLAQNPIFKQLVKIGSKLGPVGRMRLGKAMSVLRYLRYAKGAFWGAGIGLQVALLFGLPWYAGVAIGAGAGIAVQLAWEKIVVKLAAKASDLLTQVTMYLGRAINVISNIFVGSQFGKAVYDWAGAVKESFLTGSLAPIKSVLPQIALPAIGFGLAIISALALGGIAGAIMIFALAAGLLIEAGFRLTYNLGLQNKYPSFIGFLNDKLFRPAFDAIASGTSILFNAMFSILGGFLVALTSTNMTEFLQGVIMAAMGAAQIVGMSASVAFAVLAASGLIISTPQKASILGATSFESQKVFVTKTADLKQFTYNLNYTYRGGLLDPSGNNIDEVNLRLFDTYEGKLERSHIQIGPDDYIDPDAGGMPLTVGPPAGKPITVNINDNRNLAEDETRTITHTLNLKNPLNTILSGDDTMCDRFSLVYEGPTALDDILEQVISTSNTICLDKDGNLVVPPPALFAQDLARCLDSPQTYRQNLENFQPWCQGSSCQIKTYTDHVTKYDFSSGACQTSSSPTRTCPLIVDPGLNLLDACLGYAASPGTKAAIRSSAINFGALQCVGFVRAVEAQYGRTLPSTSTGPGDNGTACRYSLPSKYCVSDYTFSSNTSQAQPGDMLIFGHPGCVNDDGSEDAGHIAYIVENTGRQLIVADANITSQGDTRERVAYRYNHGSIRGYLRYTPGHSCP